MSTKKNHVVEALKERIQALEKEQVAVGTALFVAGLIVGLLLSRRD